MGNQPRQITVWQVYAASVGVSLAFCILVAITLLEARRENWNRASQSAQNLSRAVAVDIGRAIESLDLSLQAVVEHGRMPEVLGLAPRMRDLVLFDRATTASGLGFVILLNSSGEVVASTAPHGRVTGSFADSSYFIEHRQNADLGLHVSGAFYGRVRSDPVLALSRRISDADGSFGGVAVGTMMLDAIRTKFEAVHLGPRDSISLFHEEGTLAMRVPYRPAFIGSDMSHTEVFRRASGGQGGQFVATSAIDAVQRLHVYAKVPGSPLHLAIALSVDDLEDGWRRQALGVGLATLALVFVLMVVSRLFGQELRRRQKMEVELCESEASFRLLAENSSDMVSRIGPDGRRRYVSPASLYLLGYAPDELIGQRPRGQVHPNDLEALDAALDPVRRGAAEQATLCYRGRRADGTWVWLEAAIKTVYHPITGKRDGLVAVTRDVTARKAAEDQLAQLASQDGLTGIANRRTFDEVLVREWRRAMRAEMPLSLLLVDIDCFKALNDSQGHQRGDDCLREVASVLRGTVRRASDLAARYGGEEFVLLLPDTDAAGAEAVAERVRAEVEALALSHPAGGLGGVITVSVGAATVWPCPVNSATPPTILTEDADQCLYRAKRAGRNRVVHSMMLKSALVN